MILVSDSWSNNIDTKYFVNIFWSPCKVSIVHLNEFVWKLYLWLWSTLRLYNYEAVYSRGVAEGATRISHCEARAMRSCMHFIPHCSVLQWPLSRPLLTHHYCHSQFVPDGLKFTPLSRMGWSRQDSQVERSNCMLHTSNIMYMRGFTTASLTIYVTVQFIKCT